MADFLRILTLAIEAALLVVRWRYDPERLKRELAERIDHEQQTRRQAFRDAAAKGDEDAVARMLARARDRARDRAGRLPDGAADDVPARERPDGAPESR
jgi:hypothetical protein